MGVIWFWGGEHGTVNEFDSVEGGILAAETGMSGSYCLNISGVNTSYAYKNVTSRADYYVGERIYFTTNLNDSTILSLWEGTTLHITVKRTDGGTIQVMRYGTVIATGTANVSSFTTHRIEVYAKIDDLSGQVIVKVNGLEDINFSGDTRNGGALGQISRLRWGYTSAAVVNGYAYSKIDDIVIRDDTWPGDVRVGGKEVVGDSSPQQWLVAGTTHYISINDTDDTDYIYTNQNMRQELYEIADITEPVYEVKAVKLVARARTEGSASPTQIKFALASAGTTVLTEAVSVGTSYVDYPYVYQTNPLTGDPFTVSDLNNIQVGVQSNDPSLVARWCFNSEGTKYDNSISSYNYLTPVGGTLYVDTDTVKEGTGSIKYQYSWDSIYQGYLILEDVNASADFPLRTSDTQKLITMCGWINPTNVANNYPVLFGKAPDWSNGQGISLQLNNGVLYVLWAYYSAGYTSNLDLNTNLTVSANRWYHLGVTADGVNRACTVRFYDEYNNTASTVNFTPTYQMVVGSNPFRIGNTIQSSTYYGYTGCIDDLRVYNRRLAVGEIDLIRQGVN